MRKTGHYSKVSAFKVWRLTAIVLAVAVAVVCLPLSSLAVAPEPEIGAQKNVAEDMTVINAGADYPQYKTEKKISVAANTSGEFSGLYFNSTNSFVYSAVVLFTSDTSTYGSIRLVLGNGIHTASGNNKQIEVCIRPKLNQAVLFLSGGGEVAVKVKGLSGLEIGSAYRYTVRYNNGVVSFWVDGTMIFDSVDVAALMSNIKIQPGFYSQNCAGELSDIKLWGGVEPMVCPGFDTATDTNLMDGVVVNNPLTGVTGKLNNHSVTSDKTDNARMTFYGIRYSDSYCFSADAAFSDNKNLTPGGNEYNWEGLIFKVATAVKDSKTYDIEIRVRANLIGIFAVYGGNDTEIKLYWGKSTAFDAVNSYTAEYKQNGCLNFWKNGISVFYGLSLADYGYSPVTPCVGIGAEVCSFSFANIRLWGDLTVIPPPEFNGATDRNLIPETVVNDVFSGRMYKLTAGTLSGSNNTTGRVDFSGMELKDDYTFYTTASFSDNKNLTQSGSEYNWESLIFRVAAAEKANKKYTLEIRVRSVWLLVYAVADDGTETVIYQKNTSNAFDTAMKYIVDYHADGTFDFWQNGISLLYGFDPAAQGYTTVKPAAGIGCEVCNFSFTDMKLVCKNASLTPGVPAKPQSNGDYADTMVISSNPVIAYENGVIASKSAETAATALFQYLPFSADETYVYGFTVKTQKTEKQWMGPRAIFGADAQGRNLALFITENALIVAAGSDVLLRVSFTREADKEYRIDMLIESDAVSVWVNDILIIEKCATPDKVSAKTAMLFENAVAEISDIDLYYTSPVEYIPPVVPQKPVLKNIGANQFNAAKYMSMTLNNAKYGGYFGCRLFSDDDSKGNSYMFENLPINDSMSYYYSATYRVTQSTANWKGPRFIFRYSEKMPMYIAVTQSGILVLAGSEQVAFSPLKLTIGKSYDIVIYSTPDAVTVWIDGQCVHESVDLKKYCNNGALSAKPGLLFELCKASAEKLAIYGDNIVFDPAYVDTELYYDTFYNMDGIPGIPAGGINLFTNVFMKDASDGSLGAEFDSRTNIFKNEYADCTGDISFVDANGSPNLNGLKNGTGYVFRFNYCVSRYEAEKPGLSGIWFTTNKSAGPWTKQSNSVRVGISGDALMIYVYKEGVVLTKQTVAFKRETGREYNIAVVHGKNWIKLFVDNELKLVATDLPTYNLVFNFGISNSSTVMKNIALYEFVKSDLSIVQAPQKEETAPSGNTIYTATEYTPVVKPSVPVAVMVISAAAVVLSAAGIVALLLTYLKKRRKNKTADK